MMHQGWLFLALQGLILLVLVVQYLQSSKLWRVLDHWQAVTGERQRRTWWQTEENRELKLALHAEKARADQLQCLLDELQALQPSRPAPGSLDAWVEPAHAGS
ncbi:hypothetical protein [Pseudomonas japonica]|uniref:Uncharacterized protein n=1 Tax=Pseudomonas japonica TaxID=256466 RepID=A0A239HU40_9PSED|nr:hypothetical protein [Pseudomonas japonica]SNS84809.1 hypothetical protein SAMN05444352_116112 [Pseudomonas japonica]